jgi:Tol biopolymer transport system component
MRGPKIIVWAIIVLVVGLAVYFIAKSQSRAREEVGTRSVQSELAEGSKIKGGVQKQWEKIGYLRVSPNGKLLAFTACKQEESAPEEDSTAYSLYIYDFETGALQEVLSGLTPFFSWSPEGNGIYYGKVEQEGGKQNKVIYYIDLQSKQRSLIAKSATRLKPSPDGSVICYLPRGYLPREEGKELKEELGIVYQKGADGKAKKTFLTRSLVMDFEWSPDRRYIVLFALPSEPSPPQYVLLEPNSGKAEVIGHATSNLILGVFTVVAPGPAFLNPKTVVYSEVEEASNYQTTLKIISYDIGKKQSNKLYEKTGKGIFDVRDILPSPQGDKLLIVLADKLSEQNEVWLYDFKVKKMTEDILKIDFGRGKITWHSNGKEIIFVKEGHIYIAPLFGEARELI